MALAQEEIQHGKKLLAEFEGYTIISEKEFNLLGENSYTGKNKGVKWGIVEYLNYDLDLRYSMSVLDKIESMGYGTIIQCKQLPSEIVCYDCKIRIFDKVGVDYIEASSFKTKQEAIFKCLVSFIEWHNTQNK
jgi:hypothetical protein